MNFLLSMLLSFTLAGSFSASTRSNFMDGCTSTGGDKENCSCLLKKLEKKYTEKAFAEMEANMLRGEEISEYMDFLLQATLECSQSSKPAGSVTGSLVGGMGSSKQPSKATPGAEQALLKVLLDNDEFKKSFVDECVDEVYEFLGIEQGKKTCQCSLERLKKDENLMGVLAANIDDSGNVSGMDQWGLDLLVPCLPTKFTPELERSFVKSCSEDGTSREMCQCAFDSIKKKYNVQQLIQAFFNEADPLWMDLIVIAAQCLQ